MALVVAGAMGNLGPKLLQLLQDEYKLQKNLRDEVKSLAQELESTHVALCKVAEVPHDKLDPQVKLWARHMREASYDMEDILDTFLVHVDGHGRHHQPGADADNSKFKLILKKIGDLFRWPSKIKVRHAIATAIKDINKQLQEVAERRDRCKVEIVAKPDSSSTIDPRLEAMYKEVTELVGIGGAVGEIISKLSLQRDEVSNDKLKIVSVLGIGGLGKTTLAKAVFDKVKSDFNCGAFVPVGRNPDLTKVFRDILIDLDENKYTDANLLILDERQLINKLRHFLGSQRYFIVVDDVWEAASWEIIRLALDENNWGSRIIITTRNSEVTSGEVYKPKPLSDENSRRLFYTRIFGGEDKCLDNQVDEVYDKILKKCGGIPLAIITMASLLVGKSREEWFEVCNSIGFRDKGLEQVDRTMDILSLSYYDLPHHLRACLLYLSAFPEDYIIDKNTLIWRWVAEGFIHKKREIGLFEVGEGYFNDLINRSMIQAVQTKYDGTIDGCRVHDMVLDLLRSLSSEENFVTLLLGNDDGTSSISNARRLAHQKSTLDTHLGNDNKGMQKMRSLIAYRCQNDKGLSFQSFKLLRVLGLENVYMKSWHNAKHLGDLLHLRYLGLKHTNMPELPEEIGCLKFLQTLDVVENICIKELPLSVGQLIQLLCLRAWGSINCRMSIPNGILKRLMSLEELLVQCDYNNRNGNYWQFKELGNLSELRVLTIKVIEMNQNMLSELLQSVRNLHKMQSIKLHNTCRFQGPRNATFDAVGLPQDLQHLIVARCCFSFSRLPPCIGPSCVAKLSHLELEVTVIDEQSLQALGGLPELCHLKLLTDSTVTITNIDGCFQKLRIGRKDECRRAPAVMPNLQELSFQIDYGRSMRKYEGSLGNLGLEYLTSLQKVTVNIDCGQGFYGKEWIMEEETGLRRVIDVHPNHPTLILSRSNQVFKVREPYGYFMPT
ncbi:unnamed protein product [Urochloa decumbens]|uniref:AAA+ ATPase domain-containing protein n=1 Tax=Urochloa decumbens TaxID=240449 RepID=A0ABC9EZR2_9POAL